MKQFNGVEVNHHLGQPTQSISINISLVEYPWVRDNMPVLWGGFTGWSYDGNTTTDRGKVGSARIQTFITTNNTRYIGIFGGDDQDVARALSLVESYIARLNEPLCCTVKQKVDEVVEDDFI